MDFKKIIKTSLLLVLVTLTTFAFADAQKEELKIGVVDFRVCMEKSYFGQAEQHKLEAMRNEMVSNLESKEKQLTELTDKLQKPDYMDALSPEAEENLQREYATLSQEIQVYQQQAYQALNQAQMKMFQNVNAEVAKSAEYLASQNKLDLVINQETCFYFKRPLEMTQMVVQDLNRHFQPEESTANATNSGDTL